MTNLNELSKTIKTATSETLTEWLQFAVTGMMTFQSESLKNDAKEMYEMIIEEIKNRLK